MASAPLPPPPHLSFPLALPPDRIFPLCDPSSYFATLMALVAEAKEQISLFFFYSTTNQREQAFIRRLAEAAKRGVKITIVLDFLRTLSKDETSNIADPTKHFGSSSQLMLALLRSCPEARKNIRIGLMLLPSSRSRVGSLFLGQGGQKAENVSGAMHALQSQTVMHCKLLAFDDTVVTMGANVSKSYFRNRQDRYLLFRHCPLFATYVHSLLSEVIELPGSYVLEPSGKVAVRVPPDLANKYQHEYGPTQPAEGSVAGGASVAADAQWELESRNEGSATAAPAGGKATKKRGPLSALGQGILSLFGKTVAPSVNVVDRGGASVTDESEEGGKEREEGAEEGAASGSPHPVPDDVLLDSTSLPAIIMPPRCHLDVHMEFCRSLRAVLRKYSHHYRPCECDGGNQREKEQPPPVVGPSTSAGTFNGHSTLSPLPPSGFWVSPEDARLAASVLERSSTMVGAPLARADAASAIAAGEAQSLSSPPHQLRQDQHQHQQRHHRCNDPYRTVFPHTSPPSDAVLIYPHFQLRSAVVGAEKRGGAGDEDGRKQDDDEGEATPAELASPVSYHFDAITSLVKSTGPCNPDLGFSSVRSSAAEGDADRYEHHDFLSIGSGYFNLPPVLVDAVLKGAHPLSSIHILTASPATMDFQEGAYSDSVKQVYSELERDFFERVEVEGRVNQHPLHPIAFYQRGEQSQAATEKEAENAASTEGQQPSQPFFALNPIDVLHRQSSDDYQHLNPLQISYCSYLSPGVALYEFNRRRWTFHGKGLFLERHYYRDVSAAAGAGAGAGVREDENAPGKPFLPPCCQARGCIPSMITSAGSSNFGVRSESRDLELQFECASSHPRFVALMQLERECLFACDLQRRKVLVTALWALYPPDVKALLVMPETSAPTDQTVKSKDSKTRADLENREEGQAAGDVTELQGERSTAGPSFRRVDSSGSESSGAGGAGKEEEEEQDKDIHVVAVGPRGVLGSAGPVWEDDKQRRIRIFSLKRGLWLKALMKGTGLKSFL